MQDLDLLEQQAVDAAINQHWNHAIRFNLEIVKTDTANLPACLRLGFAYLQLYKIKEAKKYYYKALKIQPKHAIALENLERMKILDKKGVDKTTMRKKLFHSGLFIEIPGKTKTATLVNYGQKNIIAKLLVGQELEIKIKKRKVEIRTFSDEYIGTLPDDLSRRLIFFIKGKSTYSCYIKEASLSRIVIFIKEEAKGKHVAHAVSFPSNIQKQPVMQTSHTDDEKTELDDETAEDPNSWEHIVNNLPEDEKETIPGITTEEPETEEE